MWWIKSSTVSHFVSTWLNLTHEKWLIICFQIPPFWYCVHNLTWCVWLQVSWKRRWGCFTLPADPSQTLSYSSTETPSADTPGDSSITCSGTHMYIECVLHSIYCSPHLLHVLVCVSDWNGLISSSIKIIIK